MVRKRLLVPALLLLYGGWAALYAVEIGISEDGHHAVVEDGFLRLVFENRGGRCTSLVADAMEGELAAREGPFQVRIEEPPALREPVFTFEAGENSLRASWSPESERLAGVTLVKEFDFTHSPLVRVAYRLKNESGEARRVTLVMAECLKAPGGLHYASPAGLRDAGTDLKSVPGEAVRPGSMPAPERLLDCARPWLVLEYKHRMLCLRWEQDESVGRASSGSGPRVTLSEKRVDITREARDIEVPAFGEASLTARYIVTPASALEGFRISGVGRGFVGGYREAKTGFMWRVVPFVSGEVMFSSRTLLPGRRISVDVAAPVKTRLRRGRTVEGVTGEAGREGFLSVVCFDSEELAGDVLAYRGEVRIEPGCTRTDSESAPGGGADAEGLTRWASPYYRGALKVFPLWKRGEGAGAVDLEEFLDMSFEPPHEFMVSDPEHLLSLPEVGIMAVRNAVEKEGGRLLLLYPRELTPRLLERAGEPGFVPAERGSTPMQPGLSPLRVGAGTKEERKDRGSINTGRLLDAYPLPVPLGVSYKPSAGAEVLLTARDGSPLAAAWKRGKGTVVAAVLPPESAPRGVTPGREERAADFIYREYGRSFLARAVLLAAGREPEVGMGVEVSPIGARGFWTGVRPSVAITLESRLPVSFDGVLYFRIRDRWGELVEKGRSRIKVRPGRVLRRIDALFAAGGGDYFVDVRLRQGRHTITWAAASYRAARAAEVQRVEVLVKSVLPGRSVPVEVKYRAERRAVIRLSVLDADGRSLYVEERLVEPTREGMMGPSLPVGLPEGDRIRVRASVLVKGIEADRKDSAPVSISDKQAE